MIRILLILAMLTTETIRLEAAARLQAKQNFLLFTKYTKPDFQINWHHRVMADKLQLFAEEKIKKLMIFLPPQVGKSEMSTRRLPAFMLGQNPNKKIGVCAYNQTFASKFNRQIQRIIMEDSYKRIFSYTNLNEKKNNHDDKESYVRNSEEFEIVGYSGSLKTVGVNGPLTGNTIDVGIIDDPIKSHKEAYSLTYRESLWNWYIDEFCTRLHNDSQQLITLTRWHHDDLAGRILEQEGDEWVVIKLPALNEDGPNEYDPREVGEAIWPERQSLDRMKKIEEKNPRTFTSLYQQRPSIAEGTIIKRKYLQVLEIADVPTGVWDQTIDFVADTAYKKEQANDPSGIMAYTTYNNDLYIVSFSKGRYEFAELCEFLGKEVEDNGTSRSKIYIEPKASGLSIIQYLKKNTSLNVVRYDMDEGDKIAKANSIQPELESLRVFLIKGSWNRRFIDQCADFPNATHDEEVDCLIMAVTQGLIRKSSKGGRKSKGIDND